MNEFERGEERKRKRKRINKTDRDRKERVRDRMEGALKSKEERENSKRQIREKERGTQIERSR